MCDLDHFKLINDTYGHQAGDSVLTGFADVLRQHTRSEDLACRLGGDEFSALIPRLGFKEASEIAKRISVCFAQLRFHSSTGEEFRATVSIGVGHHRAPIELPQLLALADRALYEVKRDSHNLPEHSGLPALQHELLLSER